ncbi:Multisynthetase complex auxiliary component p43 [Pyrenophora tritici-repentis]|nr:Multisynthetase complex auxiliary component p43 [Pyrenophora tritici-repentis]KAI0586099.1 Multisynthetase complex auxiliary component p43 [Pyrenophora tritici-repentis]KAI0611645.1 Multisynthetase complex auxiliary component p43 [Pyrenophora tritici-repentis]KAI0626921.1 Multisynthetase complex auxiliary component p43 [Pyrenophora tritici-repentis]KAI1550058.1 multisynthetase complex auxiliary component p43 [Pyrenophora tritici-repentis]
MATLDESLVTFLKSHAPNNAGAETDAVKASQALYPQVTYTDAEKTELSQWLITASHIASPSEDAAKSAERLSSLNTHLSSRTTLLGAKPSIADIAIYHKLAPVNSPVFGLKLDDKVNIDQDNVVFKIKPVDAKAEKERKKKEKEAAAASAAASGATPTTLTGDQSQGGQGGQGGKSKAEKAKGKTEAAGSAVASAVVGNAAGASAPGGVPEGAPTEKKKKEKKEKQPKPQKAAPVEKPLSPALIDLRVGHILKAETHPNADSLYVSTIACGDAPGTDNTSEYEGQVVRTVCSGLNGLIPLSEMQNRKIVAVCNLKPVTMRGVKSCAMVLAASPRVAEGEDSHKGPVELVDPPKESKAGDRVYFEGWEGEPEPVLNPKKKVWEMIQPGFTTTDGLEVGFDVGVVPQLSGEGPDKKTGVAKLRTAAGLCSIPTLKGGVVR